MAEDHTAFDRPRDPWLGPRYAGAMLARAVVVAVAVLVSRVAFADPVADTRARIAVCRDKGYGQAVDTLGAIAKVEPIGHRPLAEAAQLFGAKARAYAMFHADGTCSIVPVVGKAAAATKGDFGNGATVAYLVQAAECTKESCPSVVSVKTAGDALVDAIEIEPCVYGSELSRVRLHGDRDSLQLECWNSGGADRDLAERLIDVDHGTLAVVADAGIGIAWIQVEEGHEPYCVARPPGGITIAVRGDAPEIDIASQAHDEGDVAAAAKAHVEWKSSGCEQTFKTRHYTYDTKAHRFVPAGPVHFGIATKLCKCPAGHK